jgi:hypothetical protein
MTPNLMLFVEKNERRKKTSVTTLILLIKVVTAANGLDHGVPLLRPLIRIENYAVS